MNPTNESENTNTSATSQFFSEELKENITEEKIEETVSENQEEKQDVPEEPEEKKEIVRKKQNVTTSVPISSEHVLEDADTLAFPADFEDETAEALSKMPNVDILDNPESREWVDTFREGLETRTYNEAFVESLEEEDADFHNSFEYRGKKLNGFFPRFQSTDEGDIKGARAVMRMMNHIGAGSIFQTPLWHSGLYVTFKPANDVEKIEFNRMLMNDKIKFGRLSYGLIFSNISSYTTDRLVDFALSHVYDISAQIPDLTIENLKKIIVCQDIPSLLWGFQCSMYPKGFKFRRACVANPDKCQHILEETLNLSKIQYTNFNALTEWQKTFMMNRQAKSTKLEDVERYKEEMAKIQSKRIVVNKGLFNEIAFTLRSPSIQEHVESGQTWIGRMTEQLEQSLTKPNNDNERNEYIKQHGQATAMRQYGHFVESIEFGNYKISDRETIDSTLNNISSDDNIRIEFTNEVIKYINESTVSVIGIPTYDCPKCHTPQDNGSAYPHHKNIIPLDVTQLFFGLLTQRLSKLTQR